MKISQVLLAAQYSKVFRVGNIWCKNSVSKVCVLQPKGSGAGSTSATLLYLKGGGAGSAAQIKQNKNPSTFARQQIQP